MFGKGKKEIVVQVTRKKINTPLIHFCFLYPRTENIVYILYCICIYICYVCMHVCKYICMYEFVIISSSSSSNTLQL